MEIKKHIRQLIPRWVFNELAHFKFYKLRNGKTTDGNYLVMMVDGREWHGGLCDRFKGIVTTYACYKALNIDNLRYKIFYTFPFDLHDFLVPDKYDWSIAPNDITDNFWDVTVKKNVGCTNLKSYTKLNWQNKTHHQMHITANRDLIANINSKYNTHFDWGTLFKELFKPTTGLQSLISQHKANIGKEYISVAFRMQNIFGDFKEYDEPTLSADKQNEIKEKCFSFLKDLTHKTNMPVLVTSDSSSFLSYINGTPDIYAMQGEAAHVDQHEIATHNKYLKSFLDFYMLAGGVKVYAPYTEEMYISGFSEYAAKLNNVEFIRIKL